MQKQKSMVRTWPFTSGSVELAMAVMADGDDVDYDDNDDDDNDDDIRSHERSIAAPLSLGVKGLKNNLKEEGLFR